MSARSVLFAGCRWLRQKLDLVERLAQDRNEGQREAQMRDRRRLHQDRPGYAESYAGSQRQLADAAFQSRAQVPGAVNNWSVSCSQQSNFSAQILDSVNHTSLSLETRQSDTVLTVSEGRAA